MKKFKKIDSLLYVEDEQAIQYELAEFLENFCEKLYIANNGVEGLELFNKHKPKLVLTDIKMPKMDGITLSKEIFKLDPNVHIIFTTAFTDMNYLQEAIEIHADGYIVKPIDLNLLENMLQKVIKIELLQRELDKNTQYDIKKKAELETILATTPDGIAILDFSANFLYANHSYIQMLGYTLNELKKINLFDIAYDNEKVAIEAILKKVIKDEYIEHFQQEYITKNGKKIIVDISLALMPDKNRILIATKDITKEVYSQNKIEEYLSIIDENIITSSTDLDGIITYVSKAFCDISGYSKEELIGKKHNLIRSYDFPTKIYKELWNIIKSDKIWTGEIKNINKLGKEYWLYIKIYPAYDEDGIKIGYTSIHHDITNLKRIEEIAIIDSLTQVYNRYHFNETIGKYIQSAKRNNELICFAIFDIDHFKQYNDTYGHQKGDYALQNVAKAIKELLTRVDDNLFRLGGEEFGVLYKATSKEKAISYMEEMVSKVENLKIEHSSSITAPFLTISAGLVCKEAILIENEKKLYKEADDLLYKAKSNGKNQLEYNKE